MQNVSFMLWQHLMWIYFEVRMKFGYPSSIMKLLVVCQEAKTLSNGAYIWSTLCILAFCTTCQTTLGIQKPVLKYVVQCCTINSKSTIPSYCCHIPPTFGICVKCSSCSWKPAPSTDSTSLRASAYILFHVRTKKTMPLVWPACMPIMSRLVTSFASKLL